VTVVGEAFVTIKPITDGLGQKIASDIQKQLGGADLSKAGADAGKQLGTATARAAAQAVSAQSGGFVQAGEVAGKQLGTAAVKGASTEINASAGTLRNTGEKLGGELGTSAGKGFTAGFSTVTRAAIAVGLGVFLRSAFDEAAQAQKAGAQTEAVLKSTGNAAHVSADQLQEHATQLGKVAAVDNDVIVAGANMLLTFTNIRNEAGKNNDIFDQAVDVSVDMAAAMAAVSGGQVDLKATSIQLGKALNDPVKGITALSKVGVTFTADQKAMIKSLVDSGNILGAQKIILAELRREFSGSAAAQATDAERGKLAIKDFEEAVGTTLLPVMEKGAQALQLLSSGFSSLPGPIRDVVAVLGLATVASAGVGNLVFKLGTLKTALQATDTGSKLVSVGGKIGQAGLVAAAGVAAYELTTLALTEAWKGEQGLDVKETLDAEAKAADRAAHAVGKNLAPSWIELRKKVFEAQVASTSGLSDLEKLVTVAKGLSALPGPQKLVVTLRAFRDVAEKSIPQAIQILEHTQKGTVAYNAMVNILGQIVQKHNEAGKAEKGHKDELGLLVGKVDETTDAFKANSKVFGSWLVGGAERLGVTEAQITSLAKAADEFASSMQSALDSTTNPFSNFQDQTEVSAESLKQFLVGSELSIIDWAAKVKVLISRGVDVGLVQETAKAGPKAGATLDALIQITDDKLGVDWVNSVRKAGQDAVDGTDAAFRDMTIKAAIHAAELRIVTDALFLDIKNNGTTHLQELLTNSDKALGAMAFGALLHLGEIRAGVEALPREWPINIPITIDVRTNTQVIGAGLPDVAGMAEFIRQQELDAFLKSLGKGHATGGTFSGWSWVGEQGPELINVGSATATVLPHEQSVKLAQQNQQPMIIDRSTHIAEVHIPVQRTPVQAARAFQASLATEQFLSGGGG